MTCAPDDMDNDELEESYLQAQADIAADPSLRKEIEEARKSFKEGRFYTTDEVIELIKRGTLPK